MYVGKIRQRRDLKVVLEWLIIIDKLNVASPFAILCLVEIARLLVVE